MQLVKSINIQHRVLQNQKAQFFDDITQQFYDCHSSCKECSNPYSCDSCNKNFYQFKHDFCGKCEANQTFNTQSSNCDSCSDKCICDKFGKCISCIDPSKQKLVQQNTCVDCKSIENMYISKDECKKCNISDCLACKTNSNTVECTKCFDQYNLKQGICIFKYYNNRCKESQYQDSQKKCKQCSANCLICTSDTKCLKCQDQYFIQTTFSPTQNDRCTSSCPEGNYIDGLYCKRCSFQCKECDSSGCLVCNEGYFTKSGICSKCDLSCKTCETSEKCLTCNANEYVQESGKCSSCNNRDSVYIDQDTNICKKCPQELNCVNCINGSTCKSCMYDDFLLEEGKCGKCDSDYGNYKDNRNCYKCSQNCKRCKDKATCEICYDNYFLKSDNSCSDCKQPAYYILNKKCLECKKELNCYTCDQNQCLSCEPNLYLYNEGKCGNCLEKNFYKSGKKCLKCPELCGSCENDKKCTSCIKDTFLFEDFTCKTECNSSIGYFQENFNCKKCNSSINCKTCSNFTTCNTCNTSFYYFDEDKTCKSCEINKRFYIESNFKCKNCNPQLNCETCTDGKSCDTCQNNFFMDRETKICEPCKEDGKFIENKQYCLKCDQNQNCKTCLSLSKCETCNLNQHIYPTGDCKQCQTDNGYFIQGLECKKCNQLLKCKTCLDFQSCQDCSSGLFLYESKKCDECNEEGVFQDKLTNKCVKCDSSCKTCYEGKKDNCLSCSGINHFLHEDNTCKECEDGKGQVANKTKCFQCPGNCKKCDKDNPKICLECFENFNFIDESRTCGVCETKNQLYVDQNRYCKKCHQTCQECSNSDEKSCITCIKNLSFNIYKGKICEKCDTQNGYFVDEKLNECTKCHSSCKKCKDESENSCIECEKDLSFLDGKCKKCETSNKYYIEQPTNLCRKCHNTCQTCNDNIETNCIECLQTLSFNNNKKCEECNLNLAQYVEQSTNTCKKCHPTCATCSGPNITQCSSCVKGLSLFSDNSCRQCKSEENKFVRESDNTCQDCHKTCSKCMQAGEDKCDECANDLSFDYSNKCISCPKQKFYVKNRRCLNCHYTCLECLEEGAEKCQKCDGSLKKQPDNTCAECKKENQMFLDNEDDRCKNCNQVCQTCEQRKLTNNKTSKGNEDSDCLSCKGEYHFMYDDESNINTSIKRCVKCPEEHFYKTQNGYCMKCHPSCKKCSGPLELECISCEQSNHYFLDKKCQECPSSGYYTQKDQCLKCAENCDKCTGSQIEDCQKCKENFYFYVNKKTKQKACQNCPNDLYFVDDVLPQGQLSKTCDDCHFSCQQCLSSSELKCSKCKDSLYFMPDNKCETCPENKYFISKEKCLQCDQSCQQCNGSKPTDCTKCTPDKSFHYLEDYNLPISQTNTRTCQACQINNGFYLDGDTCKKCYPTCQSCSGPEKNQCKTCVINMYLYDDMSCSSCPSEKYFIFNLNQCKNCHETCLTCDGQADNQCIKCDLNLKFDQDNKCINCKKDNYYTNGDKCLPCDKSCLQCHGSTADDCEECQTNLFRMETNNRCEECPLTQFYKYQKYCKKCDKTCLTCNSEKENDCKQCKMGLHFSHDTHICIDCLKKNSLNSEKTGFYIDESSETCRPCSEACSTCNSNQLNSCKSCVQGFYFDKKLNEKNEGTCIKCLAKSYVEDNKFCLPCHSTCKICTKGGSEKDCDVCEQDLYFDENDGMKCKKCDTLNGFYIYQNKYCRKCSSKCKSCEGPLDSDCISCPENQYFLEEYNYKKCGVCVTENNFKEEAKQLCHKCHESCKLCENKSDKCIKCIDNKYMYPDQTCKECPKEKSLYISGQNCLQCHDSCLQCSGGSPQQCELCKEEYKLTPLKECKECQLNNGYFIRDKYCVDCHRSCQSCEDESETKCKVCRENLYFHPDKICKQCPIDNGYYLGKLENFGDNQVCLKCDATCKVCKDQESSSCIVCEKDLYFLDGLCKKCDVEQQFFISSNKKDCSRCHQNCQTCQGEKKDQCIACVKDMHFIEDTQECAKCELEKGYYQSNGRCFKCHQSCETCRNGLISGCQKCKATLSFIDDICYVCNINDGFYIEPSTNKCKKCSENCKTCTEHGLDKCKTCKPNLYFSNQNICEICNDTGFFTKGDKCLACDKMCYKCEKETADCTECQYPNYLQIDKSCKECDINNRYFIEKINPNPNKDQCVPCHEDCQTCKNKFQQDCIKCKYPYTFFDTNNICQNCHIDCSACFGIGKNQCKKCLDPQKYIKVQDQTCGQCEPNEFHDNLKCFNCSENCLECQKIDECLRCGNGTQIKRNNLCGKCEQNEYIDENNRCQPCDKDCLTCNGPNQNQCILCNNSLYIRKDSNLCGNCDSNQFNNKIKCIDCHNDCQTCQGPNSNSDCLSCNNSQLYQCIQSQVDSFFTPMNLKYSCEKACLQCHTNCKTCFGSKQTECMTCSFGILQKDLSCSKYCPDGKFFDEDSYQCQPCDANCTKCTGVKQCTECQDKFTLFNGVCFQCKEDQYIDEKEMKCIDCHTSCKTCRNKTMFDCIECKNEEYFFDQFNKCVADCSEGYIKNRKIKRCQECLYQRRPNNIVECVLECESNQYGDKKTRFCLECINNCSRCTAADKCSECKHTFSFSSIQREACRVCKENEFVSDDNFCVICPQMHCETCNIKQCTKCEHTYNINKTNGKCYYDQRYDLYQCKDLNKDDDSCEKEMTFIDNSDFIMKSSTIISITLSSFSSIFLGSGGFFSYTLQMQQIIGNNYFYKNQLKTLSLGPTFYQQNYQLNVLSIIPNPLRAISSYRDFIDKKSDQTQPVSSDQTQATFNRVYNINRVKYAQQNVQININKINQSNESLNENLNQQFGLGIFDYSYFEEVLQNNNQNINDNINHIKNNGASHSYQRLLGDKLINNNLSSLQAVELSKRTIDNFIVYLFVMVLFLSFLGICSLFKDRNSAFINSVQEKKYSWMIMIQMIFSNYVMMTVFQSFQILKSNDIHLFDIISITFQISYLLLYFVFAAFFFYKIYKHDKSQVFLREVRLYLHFLSGIITDKKSTKFFWFIFELRKLVNLLIIFCISNIIVQLTFQLVLNFAFCLYHIICKPFQVIWEQRYYYLIEAFNVLISFSLLCFITTDIKEFAWMQYISLVLINVIVLAFTFLTMLKIIYVRFFQKRFIITKNIDNEIDQKWREINKDQKSRITRTMSPLISSPIRKARKTTIQLQAFSTLNLSNASEQVSDINDLSIKWNMNPIYAREIALQEISKASSNTTLQSNKNL